MVSSRRFAREWALKILYQMDIGKFRLPEAEEVAMERLRREFVLRGSRAATGSTAEQISLDFLTENLRDTLPTLRVPLERALSLSIGRLFEEIPYWQETRLERAFRQLKAGVPWEPPRLLTPLPNTIFLPDKQDSSDGLSVQLAALTPEERARYTAFVMKMREELPRLLDPELRKTALSAAKDLLSELPLAATKAELQVFLQARRETLNAESAERWRKVGAMVQKQTGDWLRTAAFTLKLVQGAHTSQKEIDATLEALSSGWRLERQVSVDRNILRIAAFEMLFLPAIPTAASINEAVELAKKYSTAESGRFVNGVLGALAEQLGEKPTPTDATEDDAPDIPLDIPDVTDLEEQET